MTPLLNFLNVSVCLSVSVSLSQRDEIRLTDGNRAADGSTPPETEFLVLSTLLNYSHKTIIPMKQSVLNAANATTK